MISISNLHKQIKNTRSAYTWYVPSPLIYFNFFSLGQKCFEKFSKFRKANNDRQQIENSRELSAFKIHLTATQAMDEATAPCGGW